MLIRPLTATTCGQRQPRGEPENNGKNSNDGKTNEDTFEAVSTKARFKESSAKDIPDPSPPEKEIPIYAHTGYIEIRTFVSAGVTKEDVLGEWGDIIAEGLEGLQDLDPICLHLDGGG